jgi:hypothetical protein
MKAAQFTVYSRCSMWHTDKARILIQIESQQLDRKLWYSVNDSMTEPPKPGLARVDTEQTANRSLTIFKTPPKTPPAKTQYMEKRGNEGVVRKTRGIFPDPLIP